MRSLVIGIAVALAVNQAGGQRASGTVDIGAMGLRYGDTVSAGGVSISPALSFAAGRTSLDASGTFSKFGAGVSAQGDIALSSLTPAWRKLSVELIGSAGGSGHEDGYRTGQTRGAARLHLTRGGGGAWGGAGFGAMWDGLQWRQVRLFDGGAWMSRGAAQLLVSVTPTIVDDTIRYVDNQATIGWKVARAEVGLTAGLRGGARLPTTPGQARAWGGLSLAAPLNQRTSIVVGAGTYPLDFTQGYPAGKYLTAGVRMALGRAAPALATTAPETSEMSRFDVRRLSASEVVISVQAPGARSVEIMGDITQWEPIALRAHDKDRRFSASLAGKSGASQINIRVDGGPWVVPPGLTVVKDETGTEVGILIIPPG